MDFNRTNNTSDGDENEKENYEGGQAFEPSSPEMKLYKRTINNLLEDSFYESDEEKFKAIVNAFDSAADENPEFVLKLAAYARQEMGIRDAPQLLLALSATDDRFKTKPPEPGHHEDTRIRDYTPQIIRRMDETATVISVIFNVLGKETVPSPLKKGISDAVNMMADEYTLAKYRMESREVNLYDVFNIAHVKPDDRVDNWYGVSVEEREELFERFMRGNLSEYDVESLETPNTWEAVISEQGNTEEAWRQVLPDMGIMAKIRNVRNMLESGLDGTEIFDSSDMESVKQSKMFPFRLYQSYNAYKNADVGTDVRVEEFLTDAIDQTAENLPEQMSDSLVVADTSGSMKSPVSGHSSMECYEIATFFAGIASTAGADVGAFADDFAEEQFHHQTPSIERMYGIQNLDVGGSTNGYKVFQTLRNEKRNYENVVLLTDMQLWNRSRRYTGDGPTFKDTFDRYRHHINEDVNLYIIDLQSYGDLVTPEGYENVYNISGWNERVLDFISYADEPRQIIQEIEGYEPAN